MTSRLSALPLPEDPALPEGTWARLSAAGFVRAGQAVLDLGTGTGGLARTLAAQGCTVTAVDPAPEALAEACRLAAAAGLEIRHAEARAEGTGLPEQSFDLVVAARAWGWFDRRLALTEAKRLLRPGGGLLILEYDRLPLNDNVVDCTEHLIRSFTPAWRGHGGSGTFPGWLREIGEAGLTGIETFSFDTVESYGHAAWVALTGQRMASGIMAGEKLRRLEDLLRMLLRDRFPQQPLRVPHRFWAVHARLPA
ncbi:class I SAM-dependent methyltransferase [Rhodocista pekingensis]|uniref:Class I SAM-dependent methyltransferase n=1 Tax=Rhodocista pekingensis TaxID=201185 RepID=A0ABW2KQP8_9PROT